MLHEDVFVSFFYIGVCEHRCWSLNCEERLPLLVSAFSGSVFLGVSSTKVVLLVINSSTRRNLRLLCFGVTFLISSSRYE